MTVIFSIVYLLGEANQTADLWLFLGRFHPMILHFPIGFLSLGAMLEVYACLRKKNYDETIKVSWLLGTVTSGCAVICGYLLSLGGGYNERILDLHFYAGISTFVLALTAWLLRGHHKLGKLFKFFSVFTVVVMMFAGHNGASLTHGEEYLFKSAPDFVRNMAGRSDKTKLKEESPIKLKAGELVSYQNHIKPILETNCFKCHGPEKMKSELRLDRVPFETTSENLIVAGQAESSKLYQLLVTHDKNDIMPPTGKGELTKNQITLVKRWISEGARFSPKDSLVVPFLVKKTKESTAVKNKVLSTKADFSNPQARVILEKNCIPCHGPKKQKAKLRFDTLNPDIVKGPDGEYWHEALNALNLGEMPPKDHDVQPSDEERRLLTDWLTSELTKAKKARSGESKTVLRRLTKEQYTNSLQDLLGVKVNFGKDLPPDGISEEGFHNNGQTLTVSSLHMDYYLKIASEALDKAVCLDKPPVSHRYRWTFGTKTKQKAKKFNLGYQSRPLKVNEYRVDLFEAAENGVQNESFKPKGKLRTRFYADMRGSNKKRYSVDKEAITLQPALGHVERAAQIWQGPAPNLKAVLRDFPTEGDFIVRVKAAKADDSKEDPYIRLFAGNRLDDGMEYATFDQSKRIKSSSFKTYSFKGRLEDLPLPVVDVNDKEPLSNLMVLGLWNDCLAKNGKQKNPAVKIESLEFEGPYFESWPSQSHKKIFVEYSGKKNENQYAKVILKNFISKAFRRPVKTSELGRYLKFWKDNRKEHSTFETSIKETLLTVLCSPNFLFIAEEKNSNQKGLSDLNEFELASRLSYFLWNSMPDKDLLDLAYRGQLKDNVKVQVTRMLKSPKRERFLKQFTEQWLDMAYMDQVQIDVKLYPKYNRFVKEDMKNETLSFMSEVFRENMSILNLIDSDFAMLNQNLAQYYGIKGVYGPHFRKVKISKKQQRGGLLSQGSFLSGHSSGDDSHPVKRGVWLAKKFLDNPPPPPPPNVPQIDKSNPDISKMTARKQLEMHRNNKSCRDCHLKIDPYGIPFENYDAGGLLRKEVVKYDHSGKKLLKLALEAKSTLPDETKIDGADDLKSYILDKRQKDFTRSLTKHLLAYSLGRSLSFTDEDEVNRIVAVTEKNNYKIQTLIEEIVSSQLFTKK